MESIRMLMMEIDFISLLKIQPIIQKELLLILFLV